MTPDARFLAGPVPGVRGLWTATGCNGSGFSIEVCRHDYLLYSLPGHIPGDYDQP